MDRVCKTCKRSKPIDEFTRLGRKSAYRRKECKACRAGYEAHWRKHRAAFAEPRAVEFSWERERAATDRLLRRLHRFHGLSENSDVALRPHVLKLAGRVDVDLDPGRFAAPAEGVIF